jgi:flagellar hook-associated protein 2
MGSPITFSGFNQVDFNVVLNAIMQQESQPLQILQQQQQSLQSADAAYSTLATKLAALHTASDGLSHSSTVTKYAATSSDTSALVVADAGSTAPGHYTVVVNDVAQAQVTASTTTAPDADTTVVASGGTLTIGGVDVTVTGDVTLTGLRDLINNTSGIPATASVVATAPGQFRLVLNGNDTGTAHAFTISNALTGGSGLTFGGNAQEATNASVLINNIAITSSSNTLDAGIPGVSVTVLKKDPLNSITVDVSRNDGDLKDRMNAFVTAYNDLISFVDTQTQSGALGHEALLRNLRASLRASLTTAYGTGAFTRLPEIGLGFTRTGQLTIDDALLTEALTNNASAVASLFTGASNDGVFASVGSLIDEYTQADGLVPDARTRISGQITRVGDRIFDMQAQLAQRRLTLQQEFTAADEAMSRLNSQSGSLASLSTSLISNPVK